MGDFQNAMAKHGWIEEDFVSLEDIIGEGPVIMGELDTFDDDGFVEWATYLGYIKDVLGMGLRWVSTEDQRSMYDAYVEQFRSDNDQ